MKRIFIIALSLLITFSISGCKPALEKSEFTTNFNAFTAELNANAKDGFNVNADPTKENIAKFKTANTAMNKIIDKYSSVKAPKKISADYNTYTNSLHKMYKLINQYLNNLQLGKTQAELIKVRQSFEKNMQSVVEEYNAAQNKILDYIGAK